ncbi:MsnO8 family LLM class oxidoreductase [Cellulomonas wangsupingiae]|uniref:MsnO8 family LLM class oxidoreductase n=1 Tax=Cellulomonas wangsupingiae TaxID=2968085 RepID=A0ABY5K7N1_9CELL|nr:MsnO8 family LLM class oxidoreductase [Cellulomonas wangsupingiae]MCC2334692.1 MsnO8 family LLM class oxidoreductase [Cellulomonas wangsupingiae]MCM0638588.1 MsnO8 family LLM class oxidoreductase [Cellulomonas wangsupingiae]UUI66350.1 MsnO8 family LLM class oxidoreductase [Cellulomonas wangsupingiae]
MTAISVLDLVPVRSDQTTADALAATLALARVADEVGARRYWVAEHHNMPAVAATNAPLLMSLIAAATSRVRVGSGGVMLPNHSPLVVAEQVALLEAAFPGRVDVGIGRAPGSDPVTSHLLRRGSTGDGVDTFDDDVAALAALVRPEGVAVRVGSTSYPLRATPRAVSAPQLWLLGSSSYSAQLAGRLGLPYVFAHHFAGRGTGEAVALYRETFVPSEALAEPRTIAVANVVVAPTSDEARRLALPQVRSMWRLRAGMTLDPQELVEDAQAAPLPATADDALASMTASWIIGDPAAAAEQVRDLAGWLGTDEIMVQPVAGATRGTPADRSPAREETLRLLAAALS